MYNILGRGALDVFIKEISPLVYENPNSRVFSRAFFRNAILSLPVKEPMLIGALDLNKVNSYNHDFGENTTTNFMQAHSDCICFSLPEDAIIANDGGDELFFAVSVKSLKAKLAISENMSLQDYCCQHFDGKNIAPDDAISKFLQEYFHQASLNNGLYTKGINSTVGVSECSQGDSILDAYNKAESKVSKYKEEAAKYSDMAYSFQNCKSRTESYAYKFFSTFRLSKSSKLPDNKIKEYSLHILDLMRNFLSTPELTPVPEKHISHDIQTAFSSEIASNLFSVCTNPNYQVIPKKEDVKTLFSLLATDPITGLPNEKYFQTFILPSYIKSGKTYNEFLASGTLVKLLNSVFGYDKTDIALKDGGRVFQTTGEEKIVGTKINQDIFHPSIDKPFIYSKRGGTYVLISPSEIAFNIEGMDDIFRAHNSKGFPIVSSYALNVPGRDIVHSLKKLDDKCSSLKDSYKLNAMLNSSRGEKFLRILLAHCSNDFKQNVPDWENRTDEYLDFINGLNIQALTNSVYSLNRRTTSSHDEHEGIGG